MVNLIINAVEEMSPHAAGARDLVIRTVKTKSGSVLVAVCDSGPGVDPENLDRIFDAFFTTKGLPLTADMLGISSFFGSGPGAAIACLLVCAKLPGQARSGQARGMQRLLGSTAVTGLEAGR
jgi:signal transduction histidine kinase